MKKYLFIVLTILIAAFTVPNVFGEMMGNMNEESLIGNHLKFNC